MDPLLRELVEKYPDEVRVIYRHFPLINIHDKARIAAEASEAAGAQGDFWAFHDALYERQSDFNATDEAQAIGFLADLATDVGLDGDQMKADLESGKFTAYVEAHLTEAGNLRLPGTPSLIVNGNLLDGGTPPFEAWEAYLVQLRSLQVLADLQYDAPPEVTIDPDVIYVATVTMENGGEIVMELYPKSAPITVNSFVFLANEGYYDGVTFHRVLPGFMAQTGDPSGTGQGGPGYTVPDEIDPSLTHTGEGVVAMAKSREPNSGGSQWYITFDNANHLDGIHTVFGKVVEGMDVVKGITPRDPAANPNAPVGDAIESITISEK